MWYGSWYQFEHGIFESCNGFGPGIFSIIVHVCIFIGCSNSINVHINCGWCCRCTHSSASIFEGNRKKPWIINNSHAVHTADSHFNRMPINKQTNILINFYVYIGFWLKWIWFVIKNLSFRSECNEQKNSLFMTIKLIAVSNLTRKCE